MSTVKSFSVGNGDMFTIDHDVDSYTIIDCYYENEEQRDVLFANIAKEARGKGIRRFISTHPDEDHIRGIEELDKKISILNFYVVENKAIKIGDETKSFKKYCELRDGEAAYYLKKDCKRRWLNSDDDERGGAGIQFLWPDTDNKLFKEKLEEVEEGREFNNISPIFTYTNGAARFMWMGDMEKEFLELIKDEVEWPEVDVLFAPHHGRKSGHVSKDVLKALNPQIIVIGEASSKDLDYYNDYETIKQNSAGNITFICRNNRTDVYVENINYSFGVASLSDYLLNDTKNGMYLGSFYTQCGDL